MQFYDNFAIYNENNIYKLYKLYIYETIQYVFNLKVLTFHVS